MPLSQAFPFDNLYKTQDEKNSKLKEKLDNSSKKLKVSANLFGRVAENRSKLEAWFSY